MTTLGTLVGNRFALGALAGAGGMGQVFRATDTQTGATVAVKIVPPVPGSHVDVDRFQREASLLAQLRHPGIVAYIDHGATDGGASYLAMEWVEGTTLGAQLRTPLPCAVGVALVSAVAEALGAAHARGIVHRDIKPANVMLEGGDLRRPRLLDFGIARTIDRDDMRTQVGSILGTPGYMAPEQARGADDVDARADVYALGCLLFRCITGRTPFSGEHVVAILAKTILEDAPRMRDFTDNVPVYLDDLVASLLSKDPADRPANASELVRALFAGAELSTDIAPRSQSMAAVTSSVQRFVCAVLGVTGSTAGSASIAAARGARFERLADGSVLLVFATTSGPTDLALQSCRAALELAALSNAASFVVVSGTATIGTQVPLGDLFDRAATALETNPAGHVTIDAATATLIGDRFVVARNDAGIRLVRVRDHGGSARTLLGRPTACVGRDRELSFLAALATEAFDEGAARVALVVAPSGAGKSRLRHELLLRLEQLARPPLVLLGVADPLNTKTPLRMLGEILRRASGCFDLEPGAGETEKLTAWLTRSLPPATHDDVVPHLLEMAGLGLPRSGRDPENARKAMLRAWLAWLGSELSTRPVMLVLEDLHWGDRSTIDFVDASLRAFAASPLFVLANARPEIKTLFPQLWTEREPQELRLARLTKSASSALVRSVLEAVDDTTLSLIVERSEGNAFFLEELIRAVAEGQASALPSTVVAVIHARLDALGPDVTRVLRAASVFGGTFWKEGIAALLGVASNDRRLELWLETLVRSELIEARAQTSIPGATELGFRHDVVREAAYALLTEADAKHAHRVAGAWLESVRFQEAAVLVEHYVRGENSPKAITWACADAGRARDVFDPTATMRAQRGIDLGATGVDLGRLLAVQVDMLQWVDETDGGVSVAAAAMALLPKGTVDWYRVAAPRVIQLARKHDEGLPVAVAELVAATPVPGDDAAENEYAGALADTIELLGRFDHGDQLLPIIGAIVPFFERVSTFEPRIASKIEAVRSAGAAMARAPEEALHAALRSHDYRQKAGPLASTSGATVAQRLAYLGQFAAADAYVERALAEGVRLDLELVVRVGRYARMNLAFLAGHFAETLDLVTAVIATDLEPTLRLRAQLFASRARIALGHYPEAEALARDVRAAAPEVSPLQALADLTWSEVLLRAGRAPEALEKIERALARWHPTPFDQEDARASLVHALVLEALGQPDRARTVMSDGVRLLEETAANIGDATLRHGYLRGYFDHARLLDAAAARGLLPHDTIS